MIFKKKLAFDCTLCALNYSRKDSGKTGIYYVAFNVLKTLLKQNIFDIWLYSKKEHKKFLYNFINDELKLNINTIDEEYTFSDIDAFLSPIFAIPDFLISKKWINKFIIIHDIIPLYVNGYEHLLNNSWFSKLIESLNYTDTYFCVSNYTLNCVNKYVNHINKKNLYVTYLGIDKNIFNINDNYKEKLIKNKYNIPLDKEYFFTIITMDRRKNLVRMAKSFIEFKKKYNSDKIFVIAGGYNDHDLDHIKKIIPEITANEYFILCGYIDDNDKTILLSNAYAFIYTSLFEGFGLPVIEAMACGIPVITSNSTSLKEIAGDSAILINPESVSEHVIAYNKICTTDIHNKYSKKSIEHSKYFSWEKTCKIMSTIILDKIKKNRHIYINNYVFKYNNNKIFYEYFIYRILSKFPFNIFNKYYTKYNQIKLFINKTQQTKYYIFGCPLIKKITISNRNCYFFLYIPLILTWRDNGKSFLKFCGIKLYSSSTTKTDGGN